jgi:soluble lytic murein transglycosylase
MEKLLLKIEELVNFEIDFASKTLFSIVLVLMTLVFFSQPSPAEINCAYMANQQISDSPKERYKKGYCLINIGRFQEGISVLDGLENELPLISDYVLYYQAIGQKGLRNSPGAKKLFNRIMSSYPSTGVRERALIGLGDIYLETGNYDKAENVFRSLYNEERDREDKALFLNKLGSSLQSQGKYMEATNIYKSLWVEYPDSIFEDVAYNNAIYIGSKQGIPFTVSESDYLKRAEILFDNSMWSSSLEDFNKVTKTSDVKTKMGIAMFHIGRFEEALSLLAGINSPESLYWRAKIRAKQGRDSDASELYRTIHVTYPSSSLAPEGLYNAARLYQINDNTDRAMNIYDELIRKYPNSEFAEDGAWYLGWMYYNQGKLDQALATFSAFTNSSVPFNSTSNKYWKARILEKQGKKAEAFAIYDELAMSQTPSYHAYLAQIKTGKRPSFGGLTPEAYAQSPNNDSKRLKVDLLAELEMFDDASLEIDEIVKRSNTDKDLIQGSLLYARVNDFYNSVKIAEGLSSPIAISLSYPRAYSEIVKAYARKYGVDEYIVYSIMREESRFQKDVRSPANAIGLMQLLPSTARLTAAEVRMSGFNIGMLNIPRVNIELGIYYFKKVLNMFNGDIHLALASYNAGPGRAEDWLIMFPNLPKDEFVEEIPFRETRNYIRRILRSYGAYESIYGDQRPAPVQ